MTKTWRHEYHYSKLTGGDWPLPMSATWWRWCCLVTEPLQHVYRKKVYFKRYLAKSLSHRFIPKIPSAMSSPSFWSDDAPSPSSSLSSSRLALWLLHSLQWQSNCYCAAVKMLCFDFYSLGTVLRTAMLMPNLAWDCPIYQVYSRQLRPKRSSLPSKLGSSPARPQTITLAVESCSSMQLTSLPNLCLTCFLSCWKRVFGPNRFPAASSFPAQTCNGIMRWTT